MILSAERRRGKQELPARIKMIGPEKRERAGGTMRNRREFIRSMAAGMAVCGALGDAAAQTRREVRVGGKRVKVIDIHAHATFPEVAGVIKDGPLMRFARTARALGPDRIQELDKRGIDIQVVEVNTFWWYEADRDL